MRILSAILFSSLIFSVAFAQQGKQDVPTPAKAVAEKATPGAQEFETKANSLGLTITRAVIARGIDENKNPVEPGTEFAADGKRVYCITQITGAKESVNIEHRWYKDEVLVHTIELPIRSLNWRTQSYKTILPTMAGKWKVDVVLMPGEEIMTSLSFTAK